MLLYLSIPAVSHIINFTFVSLKLMNLLVYYTPMVGCGLQGNEPCTKALIKDDLPTSGYPANTTLNLLIFSSKTF